MTANNTLAEESNLQVLRKIAHIPNAARSSPVAQRSSHAADAFVPHRKSIPASVSVVVRH